jgi:serine/threonine protein kinase
MAKIIFKQIIKGIKYLHENNICNRDIKPENIMIRNTFKIHKAKNINYFPDDFVKLIDFSISRIYENKDIKIINNSGSNLFSPPELFNYEPYNPFSAEIYSLGITLIYFLFKKFYKKDFSNNQNKNEYNNVNHNINIDGENLTYCIDLKKENSIKSINLRCKSESIRQRKSSVIFNNNNNKDCISNLEEIKKYFEEVNEIKFYETICKMILKDEINSNQINIFDLNEIFDKF